MTTVYEQREDRIFEISEREIDLVGEIHRLVMSVKSSYNNIQAQRVQAESLLAKLGVVVDLEGTLQVIEASPGITRVGVAQMMSDLGMPVPPEELVVE